MEPTLQYRLKFGDEDETSIWRLREEAADRIDELERQVAQYKEDAEKYRKMLANKIVEEAMSERSEDEIFGRDK